MRLEIDWIASLTVSVPLGDTRSDEKLADILSWCTRHCEQGWVCDRTAQDRAFVTFEDEGEGHDFWAQS